MAVKYKTEADWFRKIEDGPDYAEKLRNIAIEKVEDILAKLESIKEDYEVDHVRLDKIKEMVIDKGKEIWELYDHIYSLKNIAESQFEEIQQHLEEIQQYKRKKRFFFF